MVAITIQLPPATLERVRVLAQREGRTVDEVIEAIANDAIDQELDDDDMDPTWRAELERRIERVRDGTATTIPAAEVFASIRARFAR